MYELSTVVYFLNCIFFLILMSSIFIKVTKLEHLLVKISHIKIAWKILLIIHFWKNIYQIQCSFCIFYCKNYLIENTTSQSPCRIVKIERKPSDTPSNFLLSRGLFGIQSHRMCNRRPHTLCLVLRNMKILIAILVFGNKFIERFFFILHQMRRE